jgi:autotransporter translocation and assembly factor TamB
MAKLGRVLLLAAAGVALAGVLAVLVVAFHGPRSAFARVGLQTLLYVRGGFRLERGEFDVGPNVLIARDVEIVDRSGARVFTARRITADYDPRGLLGGGDRAFGLMRVDIDTPVLRIVHLGSGDFNISPFFGSTSGASAPARQTRRTGQPLRLDIRVVDGRIEFANPSAFAPPGRAFALTDIQMSAAIAQGAQSLGTLTGRYVTGSTVTPVSATLVEKDPARYAEIRVRARRVPIAPIVDYLVSSPDFAVETGIADVVDLRGYALGYDADQGPQWQWSGLAQVRDGRIRFIPLAAPVRSIVGLLRFGGDVLALDGVRGVAAGIPLVGSGGMRLFNGFRFELAVDGGGPLERVRTLFAFSKRQPVRGRILAHARLDGTLDALDVRGAFACPGIATFAGIPLRGLTGSFFYNGGHLTFSGLAADYGKGRVYADGDVALAQAIPTAQMIVAGRIPSSEVPVVAGWVLSGRVETIAMLEITAASLRGRGYAQVSDKGASVRTLYDVARSAFVIGPAIARWHSGEIALVATIDRLRARRVLGAELYATHAPIRIAASAVRMPGFFNDAPVRMPAVEGTLDGVAVVQSGFDLGTTDQGLAGLKSGIPQGSSVSTIDLRARGVRVASADLGDITLAAQGHGSRFDIREASIRGKDVAANASGVVDIEPVRGAYAAAVEGTASADFARLPFIVPARGRIALRFDALLDGDRWAVAARSSNTGASIAGIPIGAANAVVASDDKRTTLAAEAEAAGGIVAVAGTNAASGSATNTFGLWARGIRVVDLKALGLSMERGDATLLGDIGVRAGGPTFAGAVALDQASFQGLPLSGDLDVSYARHDLAADGRVDLAGSRAAVQGDVTGIVAGPTGYDAALNLNASLREGDLGRLADRFMPLSARMTGSVAADVAIRGSMARPALSGSISTSEGTLRGVAFDDLRADVAMSGGVASLANGSVRLGSSAFSFGGRSAPGNVELSAASKAVDLSDFNDFFDGYDTLEGAGSGAVQISLWPGRARAGGSVRVAGAQIAGVPLGSVDLRLGSSAGAVLADVRQAGAIGSSSLHASVRLADAGSLMPDLSRATYAIDGRVSGLDLGAVAPLVREEKLGISGKLDAVGSISGSLRHPAAHATFALRDGYFQKLQILAASGRVDSDGVVTRLTAAHVTVPFADASGDARFGPGARIVGNALVNARDLSKIAALVKQPNAMTGSAAVTLSMSGTVSRPHVKADLQAGAGTAYGVAFDSLKGSASYSPGELVIGDTELVLARRRGTLALAGTLPVTLAPFALGPASKSVDVRVTAAGIDLAAFDALVGKEDSLGGILDAHVSATGSAGAPELAGSAALRGGMLKTSAQALTGVSADVALAHDTLTLQDFHGALGQGTIAASGAAHVVPAVGLSSAASLSYWSHVTMHNATIDVPNWISGQFDGDLSFTKSGKTPYLSGSVNVRNGTIPTSAILSFAQGFGQTSEPSSQTNIPGVPPLKPGEMIAYGGPLYPPGSHLITGEKPQAAPALFALPAIDLGLTTTAQNLRVRGGAIDLTGAGTLAIGGSIGAPTLQGALEAKRGQVAYFDTVFRLQRGVVTFSPDEGLLPTLDVRAVTNAAGEQIVVVVSGRLDNLNTDLSSTPPQSREQIIAMLLHGGAIESTINNTSVAQSQLMSVAQDYFTAELQRSVLFPFESTLAESLNLQDVAFIFDENGNLNVEVRKLVTPTVSALYRSSVYASPPSQAYGIAYAVRDYASLEFLQTQAPTGLQTFRFDVRVTFR